MATNFHEAPDKNPKRTANALARQGIDPKTVNLYTTNRLSPQGRRAVEESLNPPPATPNRVPARPALESTPPPATPNRALARPAPEPTPPPARIIVSQPRPNQVPIHPSRNPRTPVRLPPPPSAPPQVTVPKNASVGELLREAFNSLRGVKPDIPSVAAAAREFLPPTPKLPINPATINLKPDATIGTNTPPTLVFAESAESNHTSGPTTIAATGVRITGPTDQRGRPTTVNNGRNFSAQVGPNGSVAFDTAALTTNHRDSHKKAHAMWTQGIQTSTVAATDRETGKPTAVVEQHAAATSQVSATKATWLNKISHQIRNLVIGGPANFRAPGGLYIGVGPGGSATVNRQVTSENSGYHTSTTAILAETSSAKLVVLGEDGRPVAEKSLTRESHVVNLKDKEHEGHLSYNNRAAYDLTGGKKTPTVVEDRSLGFSAVVGDGGTLSGTFQNSGEEHHRRHERLVETNNPDANNLLAKHDQALCQNGSVWDRQATITLSGRGILSLLGGLFGIKTGHDDDSVTGKFWDGDNETGFSATLLGRASVRTPWANIRNERGQEINASAFVSGDGHEFEYNALNLPSKQARELAENVEAEAKRRNYAQQYEAYQRDPIGHPLPPITMGVEMTTGARLLRALGLGHF